MHLLIMVHRYVDFDGFLKPHRVYTYGYLIQWAQSGLADSLRCNYDVQRRANIFVGDKQGVMLFDGQMLLFPLITYGMATRS